MKKYHSPSVFLVWAFVLAIGLLPFSSSAVTVLSETFENNFPGGWSVGDANAIGTPAYWRDVDSAFGGEGAHGGNWKGYCAGVGHAGTAADPAYQNSMSAYMSKDINLSVYTAATLTFWYKIPTMESVSDRLRVYIGDTMIVDRASSQAAWTHVSVDLASYVGATRTLKFEFISGTTATAEGAYLDDILVVATAPEMEVRGNGVVIADGDTIPATGDWTDFGNTPVGTAFERTFYVHNTGVEALIPGTITVPVGYTLTVNLNASIPAGDSSWFRVRLDATAAETYTGDISIPNNDANENPYNFRITGTVIAGGWDAGYVDLGGGWRRLTWFGDYVPMGGAGWIWHSKHGFFFMSASNVSQSMWMYSQDMGWLWTGNAIYPFLYRANDGVWLWYNGSTVRWFFNMNTSHWELWPLTVPF